MIAAQNGNGELLRLDGVGVSYAKRSGFFSRVEHWAIRDVTFSVYQGETIGIIGRNGVGKTTLLRLLASIISPDRGRIMRRPGLRTVLLSLQAGFIPTLTGRQNAVISGVTLGIPRHVTEQFMERIIEFSELGEFIDQPVAMYSAGMRARLGFSVAMHVDPDVLLIDEVISVGDENFRKKSSAVIQQRVDSNETTVLVTHNKQLATSLCSRLIWIEKGCVCMAGGPTEVADAYQAAS